MSDARPGSESRGIPTRHPSPCSSAIVIAKFPSLLHLAGVPWARIGEHVGQRNLAVTANTYSHVLADGQSSTMRSWSAVSVCGT